jgi:hypothetical protein
MNNMIDTSWREQLEPLFGNISEHIDDDTVKQTDDLGELVSYIAPPILLWGEDISHRE